MTRKIVEICSQLLPRDRIDEFLAAAAPHAKIEKSTETVDGEKEYVFEIPEIGFAMLSLDGETVEAIEYGPEFPGKINKIAMGMTGDEVESLLGPPDRLWPMPHPNYVLLYDAPTFFRVELDRETEKVILMIR